MKRFATLISELDRTTKNSHRLASLVRYFQQTSSNDAAWAVYFLLGNKLSQLLPNKKLRQWAAEYAGVDDWLFDECYSTVGDLAETLAIILPNVETSNQTPLNCWVEQHLLPLKSISESDQRQRMVGYWRQLNSVERFVLHKLITGNFRVGVARRTVIEALSQYSNVDVESIAHRLMGSWTPTREWFQHLVSSDTQETAVSRPYPFYLAHPLSTSPEELGAPEKWIAEWKWDGIRAQLIRRAGQTFLWSRGEEIITDRFPEIVAAAQPLPEGTVIDGEVVAAKNGAILPFTSLQRRIGRKKLTNKILTDIPAILIAFDILEYRGNDVRSQPLHWRRDRLEELLQSEATTNTSEAIRLSPALPIDTWSMATETRDRCREQQAEGLMLKSIDGPYRSGRPIGEWWKWKITPFTVDAVLVYAQAGHGRRASLFTDYTFALWRDDELVPFAKAYSGLTDIELRRVDNFVRQNTLERFGPVRRVTPALVFEIAFENIQRSSRHKSGIAVRFPRIVRWREDLAIHDADTIDAVLNLMDSRHGTA